MEISEILSVVSFQVEESGCLEIECHTYAIALELWAVRKRLVSSHLYPFHQIKAVSICVSGEPQYPTIPITRKPMSINHELTQEALAIGMALKASVFILHNDGTYLEYLEAGHRGKTLVSYEEMIGQKAMNFLPAPLQQIVKHFHAQAVTTGMVQHFTYQSPATGTLFQEILVPYPSDQIVVHFVTPASPGQPLTTLSQITQSSN